MTTYRVTDKRSGETNEYTTAGAYDAALIKLWASGAKEDDVELKIIEDAAAPDTKPARATRSDKGKARKAVKVPRVRSRGSYYLAQSVTRCATKEEVVNEIKNHAGEGELIVLQGRELKLKVQYRLTGV